MGDKPDTMNRIIKFLNYKNRYELDDLGVNDRTETTLEVKKVLTKKNLVQQLEEKCNGLEIAISKFFNIIGPLTKRGMPSLFVINHKLITMEYNVKKLKEIAKDTTKFSNIKGDMRE